jgi:hypothetical protein
MRGFGAFPGVLQPFEDAFGLDGKVEVQRPGRVLLPCSFSRGGLLAEAEEGGIVALHEKGVEVGRGSREEESCGETEKGFPDLPRLGQGEEGRTAIPCTRVFEALDRVAQAFERFGIFLPQGFDFLRPFFLFAGEFPGFGFRAARLEFAQEVDELLSLGIFAGLDATQRNVGQILCQMEKAVNRA